MDSKLVSELQFLFLTYMSELRKINKGSLPLDNVLSDADVFHKYISDPSYHWFPVTFDAKVVGFLVVCIDDVFHNIDVDYEITEAFVLPVYRHKGLMTKALVSFMDSHFGVYVLMVLKNNFEGYCFWRHFFVKEGYRSVWVRRPLGLSEDLLVLGYLKL